MGAILAVIPVINPTSTTLYKILSALKARNSIIVNAAGRARDCTNEAARIAYQADALAKIAIDPDRGTMNPDIVGQPAPTIAKMAGIPNAENATLLLAP